jgi:hypothetical protein
MGAPRIVFLGGDGFERSNALLNLPRRPDPVDEYAPGVILGQGVSLLGRLKASSKFWGISLPVRYIKGEKLVKKGAKSGKKVVNGQKKGGGKR